MRAMQRASVVMLALTTGCFSVFGDYAVATTCVLNSDCPSRNVCLFRACSTPCKQDRDCASGSRCLATSTGNGCITPSTSACSATCPDGTACGADGICRTACGGAMNLPCLEGQACSGAVCVGTDLMHDDGSLVPGGPCKPGDVCPSGTKCTGFANSDGQGFCTTQCLGSDSCQALASDLYCVTLAADKYCLRACSGPGKCTEFGSRWTCGGDTKLPLFCGVWPCTIPTAQCAAGSSCDPSGQWCEYLPAPSGPLDCGNSSELAITQAHSPHLGPQSPMRDAVSRGLHGGSIGG